MKRESGFTILELMTVVVIVGVVVAVALPNYQIMVKNNCMTTSVNTLITNLQLARSEAIKRRQNVSIVAAAGGWSDGWTIQDAGANTLRDVTLTCNATTITETGGDTTFVYRSTGFIDAPGTFDVCDDRTGETGRQVTINTVGRPSTNTDFICP